MLDFKHFVGAKPPDPILGRGLAYNTNTVKTTFSSSVTATIPTPNMHKHKKMCGKCMI